MMVFSAPADGFQAVRRPPAVGAARLEMGLAALCVAQFSEPLIGAWFESQGVEPPASVRLIWLPVYAFVLWVAVRDRAAAVLALRRAPLLAALAALALASAAWSIAPADTVRRGFALAMTVAFGFYLGWRYSWPALLQVLCVAWALLIVGAYMVALGAPAVGVMRVEHPGAWGGLWSHKNTLAGLMALGVSLLTASAVVNRPYRALWAAFAAGAFGLVLLATGMTGLIASLAGLAVIGLGLAIRRGPIMTVAVLGAALCVVILALVLLLTAPDAAVGLIGRDLTFTGRTDIWASVQAAIAQRPWLGYGYGAFWLDPLGPAYWVQRDVDWQVIGAHNGWLELTLGLGALGLLVFLLQFAATLWRAGRWALHPVRGLWAPAFLTAFLLYTMSEGYIMTSNNLFWLLYVAVAVKLALSNDADLSSGPRKGRLNR